MEKISNSTSMTTASQDLSVFQLKYIAKQIYFFLISLQVNFEVILECFFC